MRQSLSDLQINSSFSSPPRKLLFTTSSDRMFLEKLLLSKLSSAAGLVAVGSVQDADLLLLLVALWSLRYLETQAWQ